MFAFRGFLACLPVGIFLYEWWRLQLVGGAPAKRRKNDETSPHRLRHFGRRLGV